MEHVHHKHQLTEARDNIHAELAANRLALENLQPRLALEQKAIDDLLAATDALRSHRPIPPLSKFFLAGASLKRSSWDTAQTSGALALMPYTETSRFADVYQVQGIYDQLQVQTLNGFAPLLGSLPDTDLATAHLSPAALDSLDQNLRSAKGHLRVIVGAASELEKTYKSLDEH